MPSLPKGYMPKTYLHHFALVSLAAVWAVHPVTSARLMMCPGALSGAADDPRDHDWQPARRLRPISGHLTRTHHPGPAAETHPAQLRTRSRHRRRSARGRGVAARHRLRARPCRDWPPRARRRPVPTRRPIGPRHAGPTGRPSLLRHRRTRRTRTYGRPRPGVRACRVPISRHRRTRQQRHPPGHADEYQVEQANRHKPAILPGQRPLRVAYSQVSQLCLVLEPHTPSAIGDRPTVNSRRAIPSASARCGHFLPSRHGNHHTCRVTREPAKTIRSRRHGLNSPQIIGGTSRPTVTSGARRRRGCFRGVLTAANDQEARHDLFPRPIVIGIAERSASLPLPNSGRPNQPSRTIG